MLILSISVADAYWDWLLVSIPYGDPEHMTNEQVDFIIHWSDWISGMMVGVGWQWITSNYICLFYELGGQLRKKRFLYYLVWILIALTLVQLPKALLR